MKLSKSFINLSKNNPADAEVLSHKLLMRVGMISKVSSGVYFWLPHGMKVLSKVSSIIHEEMRAIGALECGVPCIQPSELWERTGRLDDYGPEMLRMHDRNDRGMVYAPTNEEVFTDIASHQIKSFRNLPVLLYTIQSKFRDEIRPRYGLIRGREFLMKDAYSFAIDEEQSKEIYRAMFDSYLKIFHRLHLKCIPVKANSGPIGGNFNHEFVLPLSIGDSSIVYDPEVESMDLGSATWGDFEDKFLFTDDAPGLENVDINSLKSCKGVELGHLFYFGHKYSSLLDCCFVNQGGQREKVSMGSYGIGVSRAVAALAEVYGDENGIAWPKHLAPFDIGIVNIAKDSDAANLLEVECESKKIDCIYDDTQDSIGSKFAKMELLGVPVTIVVDDGPRVEIKKRGERRGIMVEKEFALERAMSEG